MALNYNKLWSLIKRENLSKVKAARIVDMSETGFKQMMERQTMSAANLERFADHFLMPISYFFDREEKEEKPYEMVGAKMDVVEEASECRMCAEKDKQIADKVEIINGLKGQIELLGFQLGKNLKTGSE